MKIFTVNLFIIWLVSQPKYLFFSFLLPGLANCVVPRVEVFSAVIKM